MPYRYSKRGGGSQFFYVHNSGYNNKSLFRTVEDYNYFVNKLAKHTISYNGDIKVIAYYLSFDSFHLVVQEITVGTLAKMMHKLSVSYSMYFNSHYQDSGKLFKGPYKEEQLATADAAIVKALVLQKMPLRHSVSPASYKWSSLKDFVSGVEDQWLDTSTYLDFFKVEKSHLPRCIMDFIDTLPQ